MCIVKAMYLEKPKQPIIWNWCACVLAEGGGVGWWWWCLVGIANFSWVGSKRDQLMPNAQLKLSS
jgi:hypothetical protein